MSITMTRGKFERLNACADERGVIAALAVDHRDVLLQAIAAARGPQGKADAHDMLAFKTAVTKILTPHASAILLDPVYGLDALAARQPGTGTLLAYEKSGYDFTVQGRLPDLLPEWSVRRLVEAGAQGIKILLYYNPFDDARVNRIKQAYIERIGAECAALDIPFFLEPLVYDDTFGSERGLVFARKKPEYTARAIEEFTQDRYSVDILKVELPINPVFTGGTRAFNGVDMAYSRQEAMAHMRRAASAATKPLIYLSAGISDAIFCEMLELVAEAGVAFSGVLVGRATWQDGIAIYANNGLAALEDWLAQRGAQNIISINNVLARCAVPWWDVYGGMEHINVVGAETGT